MVGRCKILKKQSIYWNVLILTRVGVWVVVEEEVGVEVGRGGG